MGPFNTEKNRDCDYKRPLPQRSMSLEPRAALKTSAAAKALFSCGFPAHF
jgi:hypothetical protein